MSIFRIVPFFINVCVFISLDFFNFYEDTNWISEVHLLFLNCISVLWSSVLAIYECTNKCESKRIKKIEHDNRKQKKMTVGLSIQDKSDFNQGNCKK